MAREETPCNVSYAERSIGLEEEDDGTDEDAVRGSVGNHLSFFFLAKWRPPPESSASRETPRAVCRCERMRERHAGGTNCLGGIKMMINLLRIHDPG